MLTLVEGIVSCPKSISCILTKPKERVQQSVKQQVMLHYATVIYVRVGERKCSNKTGALSQMNFTKHRLIVPCLTATMFGYDTGRADKAKRKGIFKRDMSGTKEH